MLFPLICNLLRTYSQPNKHYICHIVLRFRPLFYATGRVVIQSRRRKLSKMFASSKWTISVLSWKVLDSDRWELRRLLAPVGHGKKHGWTWGGSNHEFESCFFESNMRLVGIMQSLRIEENKSSKRNTAVTSCVRKHPRPVNTRRFPQIGLPPNHP